jgi:hypothetical protein
MKMLIFKARENQFHDLSFHNWEWVMSPHRQAKSILRPMSQLTQEITQANYNDGKRFVPIVELYKNVGGSTLQNDLTWGSSSFDYGVGFGAVLYKAKAKVFEANSYRSWAGNYPVNFSRKEGMNITNHWKLYDLMNQWHFNWRNLPSHLWIDETTLNERVY